MGGEVASLCKRVGGRLLGASCAARVACSGHEGVTQAVMCGAGSCHDLLPPTGRLLTVFLLLCCSALLFPSFFSFFISCARLGLSSQYGGLHGGGDENGAFL